MRSILHVSPRRLCAALALLGVSVSCASAQSFPYDQEMILETNAMPGARRKPMIEVHPDGKATVDFWCHSALADVTVNGTAIRFNFVSAKPDNCTPERVELDQKLAKEFLEITSWRLQKDIVEFIGSTTFRFRLSTH